MGWRVVPLSNPTCSCWKWVLDWDWSWVHSVCVEGECLSWDSFQQQQTLSRIRCNLRLKLRKVPMAGSTMCRSWEGQWWALDYGWTPWPWPMDMGHTREHEPHPPLLTKCVNWIFSYFNKQPLKSAFSQLKQHKIRLFLVHTHTGHLMSGCHTTQDNPILGFQLCICSWAWYSPKEQNRVGYSSRSSPHYVTVIRLIFLCPYLWIML